MTMPGDERAEGWTFDMNAVEEKAMRKWVESHHRRLRCRDKLLTYAFTPTGIGSTVKVICDECGASKNVTDYECW